jgi:hypothetical protein
MGVDLVDGGQQGVVVVGEAGLVTASQRRVPSVKLAATASDSDAAWYDLTLIYWHGVVSSITCLHLTERLGGSR